MKHVIVLTCDTQEDVTVGQVVRQLERLICNAAPVLNPRGLNEIHLSTPDGLTSLSIDLK